MNRGMMTTPRFNFSTLPRLAAVMMVLLACFAINSTAYARKTKPAKFGRIQVTTPSGRYQLILDNHSDSYLETSPEGLVLDELTPGRHKIEVVMPDGTRWTREIVVAAGRLYCVGVSYKVLKPTTCTGTPALDASITQTDKQGDTISYHANVSYAAPPTLDYRLRYYWTVTPSTVVTTGGLDSPDITINTAEARGTVNVRLKVEVDDGSGNPPIPGCYDEESIELSCTPVTAFVANPADFRAGEPVTFTARTEAAGTAQLHYKWTVTPEAARITSGQGTDSIIVDTSRLKDSSISLITATLDVNDDSTDKLNCPPGTARAEASCVDCDVQPNNLNALKARLDNFGIELQRTPGATGQVFVYGPMKKAQTVGGQAKDYLVNTRGIDAGRVNVKPIGSGDKVHIELFIVNLGQTIPQQKTPLEQPPYIQHVPRAPHRAPSRHRGRNQ